MMSETLASSMGPAAWAADVSSRTGFFFPEFSIGVDDDVTDSLHKMAGNTGNLLFWAGVEGLVAYDTRLTKFGPIPDRVKTLVLSMGNWISSSTDMGWYVDEIEKSKIENVIVIGAGAQAQTRDEEIVLTSGTRRFLDMVSERSVSIGVRGDFTAEVLDRLGVRNVDVVGCPSIFLLDGKLREELSPEPSLAVHTTWHGHYRDCVSELLRFGRKHNGLFVEQAEIPIIELARSKKLTRQSEYRLRYYSQSHADCWSLLDWMKRKAACYFDLPSWFEAMQSVDLAVGSRFHGNVAAAAAGARALMLTIDARTEELVRYLNMPYIPFQEFDERLSLQEVWELADMSLFLKTLPLKKARMKEFLLKNGLALCDATFAPSGLLEPEAHDAGAAERRFISDAKRVDLSVDDLQRALRDRALPLRDAAEGKEVEASEFILSYAERVHDEPPKARTSWRSRQGVSPEYVHQANPVAYDDRGMRDQWQRDVYRNALHLAEANQSQLIVDFGCGSGYKLLKYFGGFETVGIEIEPSLAELRRAYPDKAWVDGQCLAPEMFNGDIVICSDVLEHLSEPDRILSAMAASEGGLFVLSTPALELLVESEASRRFGPPTNRSHIYEWTTREFGRLVGEHLEILAHAVVNLQQATQLCVAKRRSDGRRYVVPDLVLDTRVSG